MIILRLPSLHLALTQSTGYIFPIRHMLPLEPIHHIGFYIYLIILFITYIIGPNPSRGIVVIFYCIYHILLLDRITLFSLLRIMLSQTLLRWR